MPGKNKKSMYIVLVIAFVCIVLASYRVYANVAASKSKETMNNASKAVTVVVADVSRRDMAPQVEFSASLEPVWLADIAAKVDGRLDNLKVNEGDIVAAGDLLGSLETSELSAQIFQAQGNLAAAEAALDQADADYNRYSTLAAQGAISAQTMDSVRTKKNASLGQVQAAQGALALLQEKVKEASILAPSQGVITKRYLQAGTFVRSGTPIVAIADVSSLVAKTTIGEGQIDGIMVGTQVKVKVDALGGQEFMGAITRVSPVAQLPSRTFSAEVTIPNPAGALKAGMFAKATLPTKIHQAALVVPESALVMKEDQKTVFVIDGENRARQKTITVGYVGDGWAEVLSGLAEGDQVVNGGQNKIKDGALVTPSKEAAG
ncbi:MAG: efflux RND transporter periplasmic adaptor subunit [Sporomusaceae bacterium]|nr:efflux RND transporter periplasmic adaptor subunit [Sporomusaceae bacterium]